MADEISEKILIKDLQNKNISPSFVSATDTPLNVIQFADIIKFIK
jgi:hypothetical protein